MLSLKYLSVSFHWLNPAHIPFWFPQVKLIINSPGTLACSSHNPLFMGEYLLVGCECPEGSCSSWIASTKRHLRRSRKEERKERVQPQGFFFCPCLFFFQINITLNLCHYIQSWNVFRQLFLKGGIYISEKSLTTKTPKILSSSKILFKGIFLESVVSGDFKFKSSSIQLYNELSKTSLYVYM